MFAFSGKFDNHCLVDEHSALNAQSLIWSNYQMLVLIPDFSAILSFICRKALLSWTVLPAAIWITPFKLFALKALTHVDDVTALQIFYCDLAGVWTRSSNVVSKTCHLDHTEGDTPSEIWKHRVVVWDDSPQYADLNSALITKLLHHIKQEILLSLCNDPSNVVCKDMQWRVDILQFYCLKRRQCTHTNIFFCIII